MPANPGQAIPDMTPKAAAAFDEYVALGDDRSLELLAEHRVSQGRAKTIPTALTHMKQWSAKYKWPARIAAVTTRSAEAKLEEAADLDADTFLHSSRILNERMKCATREHADAIVKMRESVRRPAPKGGTAVSVTISVEVRQLAERLAKDLGMSAEELLADAELIAAGAWSKA